MKCPKCHYLSFDPEPRCRNCGFTFALDEPELTMRSGAEATGAPPVDLKLKSDTREGATIHDVLSEAPLVNPDPFGGATPVDTPRHIPVPRPPRKVTATPRPPETTEPVEAASPFVPEVPPARPHATRTPAPATTELPLFVQGMTPPAPEAPRNEVPEPAPKPPIPPVVVTSAPAPAATMSSSTPDVRPAATPVFTTPPARKASPSRKLGPLDRDLLEDLQRFERDEQKQAKADAKSAAARSLPADRAGVAKRLGAATFDGLFLGGLCVAMLWATLRWCELAWRDVAVLPVAPTAAFGLLISFGYLLMFTAAGGQTIGKMLVGIRVVGATSSGVGTEPVSFGRVVYRELIALPSVLAFGAGLVPVFIGDGRTLHDRLAETRVVRE